MSYLFSNPPQVEGHIPEYVPLVDEGMPYTPLTKKALALSFAAHKEQVDKTGLPYVYHPFHLADHMRTEAEACVALLHDTIEDAGYTPQTLADVDAAGPVLVNNSVSIRLSCLNTPTYRPRGRAEHGDPCCESS